MKQFAERNPLILCAVGVGITALITVTALNYDKVPLFNGEKHYSAFFTEAGGLIPGAAVQVAGYRVGQVESIGIDGPHVVVTFNIDEDIRVGDRTEASIKTKSLLGAKVLQVNPRGEGAQNGPIPVDRTTPAYQLPDALGDLTATISGLDTDQLSQSLSVLSNTFKDTPPDLQAAVQGIGRFSQTLDERDVELRNLLANAKKATAVLADRSDQLVGLIADTNSLLVQLQTQSGALDQISGSIATATQQLKGLISENRDTLKPALDKLNGVLSILDDRKHEIQVSIKKLNQYAVSLGESVSSGPFFKAYLANLLPGQYIQPFVDAAFSDLGVDSSTLLPSQLTDPQVGQPATPPLPVPFPRTGQGGDPARHLPDAITGKPGDPRYPFREPLPAPPPGGPPPGPPADLQPPPTAPPVYIPAPGEVLAPAGAGQ
jgi:phospholipid/cholesterol/gamma-HCH transport system substrate-binding protein